MLVSIRVKRQPCKWCVVQEVRASEVEDAELQQAIARSLQDTKQGSFTTPCTQLHRHDYIDILIHMTASVFTDPADLQVHDPCHARCTCKHMCV